MTTRRAVVLLTEMQIGGLLDLPDGYKVLYIGADFLRQSIAVVLGSDELEPVPDGCEPPIIGGAFSRKQIIVDGELYYRWAWTPGGAA